MSINEALKDWTEAKKKEHEEHIKFLDTVEDKPCTCVFCDTEFNLSGKRSQYWILVYDGKCPHCGAAVETVRANIEMPKEKGPPKWIKVAGVLIPNPEYIEEKKQ